MFRSNLLIACLFLGMTICFTQCTSSRPPQSSDGEYQCMPCGHDCDTLSFTTTGKCPHCHMELVKKSSANFANIQPGDLCGYIATHPNTILLDVRTKDEFEGKSSPDFGTLKNAINIPVQSLDKRISELQAYKEKEIIVYCSHSHRSRVACYMLMQNGFTKVINMAGGMSELKYSDCKK